MRDLGGADFGQKRGKEGQSNVNRTEMRLKYDRNEEPKWFVDCRMAAMDVSD
jgi:hypothetical protein